MITDRFNFVGGLVSILLGTAHMQTDARSGDMAFLLDVACLLAGGWMLYRSIREPSP